MYVIIVCASVPTLRPLLLFLLGRKTSTQSDRYGNTSRSRSRPIPLSRAAVRSSKNMRTTSQENILPGEGEYDGGIQKTTEFQVQYLPNDSKDGSSTEGIDGHMTNFSNDPFQRQPAMA
jgi:hypothetical protein